jgi:hypothetical protein
MPLHVCELNSYKTHSCYRYTAKSIHASKQSAVNVNTLAGNAAVTNVLNTIALVQD